MYFTGKIEILKQTITLSKYNINNYYIRNYDVSIIDSLGDIIVINIEMELDQNKPIYYCID